MKKIGTNLFFGRNGDLSNRFLLVKDGAVGAQEAVRVAVRLAHVEHLRHNLRNQW
jgi:hypothetical protein